jgi:hypothetical protein
MADTPQPSASRTRRPAALFPRSELQGYYHSSALRTDKLLFGQADFSRALVKENPTDVGPLNTCEGSDLNWFRVVFP